ncbi:MAG: carboxyl transferase domain-containing protein [Bacillota bacterium]
MFLAGPRMLEIATGEKVTEEELGGWKLHAERTGQADVFADNDDQCMDMMKQFFTYMPSNANEEPLYKETGDDPYRRVDEAIKIVPTKRNRAYDMKKLIRLLVDNGTFFEYNWPTGF